MKIKLAIIFMAAMVILPCSAALTTKESTSEQYIKNHGYSDEMFRLIDLQHCQINGSKSNYKNPDPDWYTSNKKVKFVRDLFKYIDPGLDDEKFMQHNIDYTNRWDDL